MSLLKIIKGISSQSLDDARDFTKLLSEVVGLTKNERDIVNFLDEAISVSGVIPSLAILEDEFVTLSGRFTSVSKPTKEDIPTLIGLLQTSKNKKRLSKTLLDLSTKINEGDGLDDEDISKLQDQLVVVKDQTKEYIPFNASIDSIINPEEVQQSISSCVAEIDQACGGFHPGQVGAIFAYTGSFKSTMALNVAYKAAYVDKIANVIYVSLELTKRSLTANLISRFSATYEDPSKIVQHRDIKQNKLKEEQKTFIKEVAEPFFKEAERKVYVVDESDIEDYSFVGFENKFRQLEELAIEETGHGIDLVIIDQLSLLKFSSMKNKNEYEVQNAYVSFFRRHALNFLRTGRPISFIVLAQANREGHKRAQSNKGRYDLAAIAESNEVERASSIVISSYKDASTMADKEVKICLLKCRDGETIEDPIAVPVTPEVYLFGEENDALNETLDFSMNDMSFTF